MLDKVRLIERIKELIPKTKLIYLFGSQANGTATPRSDIDIAVFLGHKLDPIERFDIQETLAIEFDQDIDLIDLLNTSTVLQHQIITCGTCLYGSEDEQCKFEMQILSMYQRLNEERADILKEHMKK